MRLRTSSAAADEELNGLITEGYDIISSMEIDFKCRKKEGTYDDSKDADKIVAPFEQWIDKVTEALKQIFPTKLEAQLFLDHEPPEYSFSLDGVPPKILNYLRNCRYYVRSLNDIKLHQLPNYTDLPLDARLFVEDIDSFRKVRDVNAATVTDLLNDGYLDRSEDFIQTALERILNVSFHKKDWGGEINDLYTANIIINGSRCATAFLLKGNGLKTAKMEIKHCGTNGDQIVRLFNSPANLFVIQFVGRISEIVISDIDTKVQLARSQGKDAWYCIIDGQDTARVLRAYGEL